MIKRNPKQRGSNLWDCKPQVGKCPQGCNQCFYNRPNAFYIPIDEQIIPEPSEVGDGIVRMNCGHDSNAQRDLVVKTARRYRDFFFNTSIPNFNFPGPVVYTANPKEESLPVLPSCRSNWDLNNLMFVRLRVSASNLAKIEPAIRSWTEYNIPVVLTFMAYYDPPAVEKVFAEAIRGDSDLKSFLCSLYPERVKLEGYHTEMLYQYRVRHVNSYWCPTKEFMGYVLDRMKLVGGRLVTMCGTLDSNFCLDCGNCEAYYRITIKHLNERNSNE